LRYGDRNMVRFALQSHVRPVPETWQDARCGLQLAIKGLFVIALISSSTRCVQIRPGITNEWYV